MGVFNMLAAGLLTGNIISLLDQLVYGQLHVGQTIRAKKQLLLPFQWDHKKRLTLFPKTKSHYHEENKNLLQ